MESFNCPYGHSICDDPSRPQGLWEPSLPVRCRLLPQPSPRPPSYWDMNRAADAYAAGPPDPYEAAWREFEQWWNGPPVRWL